MTEHHDIRRRAYEFWERDGRPDGMNLRYWLEAERTLVEARQCEELDEGLEETFPASDPPAAIMRGGCNTK